MMMSIEYIDNILAHGNDFLLILSYLRRYLNGILKLSLLV